MNSIIIPIYNHADTLERAVQSVCKQTFSDWELILIDDGSSDDSFAVAQALVAAHPDKAMRAEQIEHKGVSGARNRGLELARGEWVSFLDSDDEIAPTFLEELVSAAKTHDADWVYCARNAVYPFPDPLNGHVPFFDGNICISKSERELLFQHILFDPWGNVLFSSCMSIYKKSILDDNQIRFSERVSYGEDLLFNYEYAHYCNCFYYLDKPLYKYYQRSISDIPALREDAIRELESTIQTFEATRIKLGEDVTPEYLMRVKDILLHPLHTLLFHPNSTLTRKERQDAYKEYERILSSEVVAPLLAQITPELCTAYQQKGKGHLIWFVKHKQFELARTLIMLKSHVAGLVELCGEKMKALRNRIQ